MDELEATLRQLSPELSVMGQWQEMRAEDKREGLDPVGINQALKLMCGIAHLWRSSCEAIYYLYLWCARMLKK